MPRSRSTESRREDLPATELPGSVGANEVALLAMAGLLQVYE